MKLFRTITVGVIALALTPAAALARAIPPLPDRRDRARPQAGLGSAVRRAVGGQARPARLRVGGAMAEQTRTTSGGVACGRLGSRHAQDRTRRGGWGPRRASLRSLG